MFKIIILSTIYVLSLGQMYLPIVEPPVQISPPQQPGPITLPIMLPIVQLPAHILTEAPLQPTDIPTDIPISVPHVKLPSPIAPQATDIPIAKPHITVPAIAEITQSNPGATVKPNVAATPGSTTVATPPLPKSTIPPPQGMIYGSYGQLCDITPNAVCPLPMTSAVSTDGFMNCATDSSCCLCQQITCNECITFSAGPSAVMGVQNIEIFGRTDAMPMGGNTAIVLQGTESAMNSVINGNHIKEVIVEGDMAAKNAKITITNPESDFKIHCIGIASCAFLQIVIIIPPPAPGTFCDYNPFHIGGIDCSGPQSCNHMDIKIENYGCNQVFIDDIICTETDSCLSANFHFIGAIETVNCDLGPSGHTAKGLSSCYTNLQSLLCQDPNSCRGMIKTLTNPSRAFSLECGAVGSCQGTQLTLNFDTRPWMDQTTGNPYPNVEHTDWIGGFKFSGELSGALATIRINNLQAGKTLNIERCECVAQRSCEGMTIITGKDVTINEILCYEHTCDGCLVKILATDPGISCYEFSP